MKCSKNSSHIVRTAGVVAAACQAKTSPSASKVEPHRANALPTKNSRHPDDCTRSVTPAKAMQEHRNRVAELPIARRRIVQNELIAVVELQSTPDRHKRKRRSFPIHRQDGLRMRVAQPKPGMERISDCRHRSLRRRTGEQTIL